LKETRPLWPPQRGVGLQEPNLGKTNPCVSLHYLLAICFAPSLADSFIFLTLTRLVVVFIFVNFSFALFTPPLGDYHQGRPRTDLQLYGLLPVLASQVSARAGPPDGSIRSEVSAAAVRPPGAEVVVVAAAGAGDGAPFVGLPLLRRPSPMEWGCSYLQRGNRSSVCNGTLDASVLIHCGCRGLNMYVISARSRVFSSFLSTKSRLLII
jgi:hypothetical protein